MNSYPWGSPRGKTLFHFAAVGVIGPMGLLGFPQNILHLHPALLAGLIVWALVWKGFALWRAARAGQLAWFVVLLVVNTAGLLEIAYLLLFAPRPRVAAG